MKNSAQRLMIERIADDHRRAILIREVERWRQLAMSATLVATVFGVMLLAVLIRAVA